jgi:orotate phosphoribosyltransferase
MNTYTVDQFVKLAKRENNKKRNYVYVNPLQGKHIPTSPQSVMNVFRDMALLLDREYLGEKILVIGFAETATAIGYGVSMYSDAVSYCTQTTREKYEDANYIYFTESHSHAVSQSLIVNDYNRILGEVDRIVFVEDEVTTGNTICKLIDGLNSRFRGLKYGILSILNSMEENRILTLKQKGIKCLYLIKIPCDFSDDLLEKFHFIPSKVPDKKKEYKFYFGDETNYLNPRYCKKKEEYIGNLKGIVEDLGNKITMSKIRKKILVLGTEEFMFLGLLLGEMLENKGMIVRFHATTRSPIMVSENKEYPLYCRFDLCSFYEEKRKTYIYNLECYDEVYILTDSPKISGDALEDITAALRNVGCKTINILRWKD